MTSDGEAYSYLQSRADDESQQIISAIRRDVALPVDINNLPAAAAKLDSESKLDVISGAIMIRRILSHADAVYLPQVIQSGVVPKLYQILLATDEDYLKYEICWIMTNVAAGSNQDVQLLVDLGIV